MKLSHSSIREPINHGPPERGFNEAYAEISGRHVQLHSLIAKPYVARYGWEEDNIHWWAIHYESSHGLSGPFFRVPRQDLLNWAKKIVGQLGNESDLVDLETIIGGE